MLIIIPEPLIWNVEDLNNPVVHKTYFGPTPAIDHNNYIIGNNVYMSIIQLD
ncbi:MAG: hypothetical protein CM15mP33_04570 [Candidatus Neomarinimicrobiota bacterium]|nr:MAG: hypothetical protein CM15mP33_04570 [Candidatus Neomarinimicrobiota bacterium]